MRLSAVLLTVVVIASVTGPDASPSQQMLDVRNAHSMIYDDERRAVVLFGGADASKVCDDTWEWAADTRRWQRVGSEGPAPRTFAAFAYDDERREGILFGGNRVLFGKGDEQHTFLNDTWRYRRGRWNRVDVSGPPSRAEAAVAYDRDRKKVVLFGGYGRTASGRIRYRDTWEWDGRRWLERAEAGPTPRNGAAMAYDERRRRVVLFGGSGGPSNETWEWDGDRWSQQPTGNIAGRFNAVMIYDAAREVVVRFGGWTGSARVDDTWTRAAGVWSLLNVPGPPARNHAAFAYDRHRRRALLFGGHDGDLVFGDAWEWDGAAWKRVRDTPAQKRIDNGH